MLEYYVSWYWSHRAILWRPSLKQVLLINYLWKNANVLKKTPFMVDPEPLQCLLPPFSIKLCNIRVCLIFPTCFQSVSQLFSSNCNSICFWTLGSRVQINPVPLIAELFSWLRTANPQNVSSTQLTGQNGMGRIKAKMYFLLLNWFRLCSQDKLNKMRKSVTSMAANGIISLLPILASPDLVYS